MDQPWRFGAPSGEVYPQPGVPPCNPYGFPGDDPRRYHHHHNAHPPPQHLPFGYPDPRTTQFAPPAPLLHRERFESFPPPWQQPSFHDAASESGVFSKRARVEDVAVPADRLYGGGVSAEDERRLNLVRNHGHQWPGDGIGAGAGVHLSGYYRPDGFQGDSQRRQNLEAEFVNIKKRPFSELRSQFLCGGQEGCREQPVATNLLELDRLYSWESSEVGHREWQRRANDINVSPDTEHRQAIQGRPDFPVNSSRYQYKEEISENENHHQHWDEGYTQTYYSGKQITNSLPRKVPNGIHTVHEDQRNQTPADISALPPVRSYFFADCYHMDTPSTSTSTAEGFGPRDFRSSHLSKYKFNGTDTNEIHRHAEPLNNAAAEIDSSRYSGSSQGIEIRGPVTNTNHANQNYPPLPLQPFPSPPPEPSLSHFRDSTFMTGPMVLQHSNSTNQSPPGPPSEPNLEGHFSSRALLQDGPFSHLSTGFESKACKTPSLHFEEVNPVQPKHFQEPKPTIVDASHLFRLPHRNTRPDHIVIILRGLPGSGKSYMAKVVRDIEIEHGGGAPRIHSIDDYFMTEVEKEEDADVQKSSGSTKSKKSVTKMVMEYCYEPEMEEAYRASMLKAYRKTLEEGNFMVVIVDDRNLRVADFAQFWAVGKRSGYEVYLLESAYKDPTGCAARNVHDFSLSDIKKMAEKWEDAPALYMRIDPQSLFHGDDLEEHGIQEVDMDMEDSTCDGKDTYSLQDERKLTAEVASNSESAPGGRWATDAEDDEAHIIKELAKSKWSEDLNDDTDENHEPEGHRGALSGLIVAYSQNDKSVHWGDQVEKRGFSIGTSRSSGASLLIGPGPGYNLKSNPLSEEESCMNSAENLGKTEPRKHSIFLEHLRAERESFKAVFDRRRQRIGIGGFGDDDL